MKPLCLKLQLEAVRSWRCTCPVFCPYFHLLWNFGTIGDVAEMVWWSWGCARICVCATSVPCGAQRYAQKFFHRAHSLMYNCASCVQMGKLTRSLKRCLNKWDPPAMLPCMCILHVHPFIQSESLSKALLERGRALQCGAKVWKTVCKLDLEASSRLQRNSEDQKIYCLYQPRWTTRADSACPRGRAGKRRAPAGR